jgi:O-antigen/teichoic acid export membrane protein
VRAWRPEPSWGAVVGGGLALVAFFLPWLLDGAPFTSGWRQGTGTEEPTGWGWIGLLLLAATCVLGLYARRSRDVAYFGLSASIAATLICGLLIATAFIAATGGERRDADGEQGSIGIPLLVIGLGLAVAGFVAAVAAGEGRERRR